MSTQEPSPATLKSQYEVMMALSIQRKGENYTLLRVWDQMRAEQLNIHRKAVDQLAEYTEASLQLSTNYVSVIKQFLSDKFDQFIKYSKYSLSSPNIDKENQLVSLVYEQPTQQLRKLYHDAKQYQANAFRMSTVIEDLLKKVQEELSETESQLVAIKEEVNCLSQEVIDLNDEAYECCSNLSDIFHKQKSGNVFKSKEDFYALQESFMVIAGEQTQVQRNFGQKVIELFKWGEETKFKRHEFLKGILIEYYMIHQEMHKFQNESSQLLDQIRKQPYKNQLSVDDILDRQLRKDVNRMFCSEEGQLTIDSLQEYIGNLKFNHFQPRNLVLKEIKGRYKNQGGEFFEKYLIVTVDAFLHFMTDKTYDYETVWTIKLDKTVKTNVISETELEIVKNYGSGGLLKNLLPLKKDTSVLNICIAFNSNDSLVEFCQFIEKILF